MKERRKLNFFLEVLIFAAIMLALKFGANFIFSKLVQTMTNDGASTLSVIFNYIDFIVFPVIASLVIFKAIERRRSNIAAVIFVTILFSFIIRLFEVYASAIAAMYGYAMLYFLNTIMIFSGPIARAFTITPIMRALDVDKSEIDIRDKKMEKGLAGHVLLMLFTFGVYNLVWVYKTTRYLNSVENEKYRNPAGQLLLCMFIPFYTIFWVYKSAQRIDKLSCEVEVKSDIALICLILEIFVPIVPPILMQDKINKIVNTEAPVLEEEVAEEAQVVEETQVIEETAEITEE